MIDEYNNVQVIFIIKAIIYKGRLNGLTHLPVNP